MTWTEFTEEFSLKYCDYIIIRAQPNKSNFQKLETTLGINSTWKADQLVQLYSFLLSSNEEHILRMRNMLHPKLASIISIDQNLPTTVAEWIGKALRVKSCPDLHIGKRTNKGKRSLKKSRNFSDYSHLVYTNWGKRNPEGSRIEKDHPRKKKMPNSNKFPNCSKCGKRHLGECWAGTTDCFLCGKEGYYAKDYYSNPEN